MTVQLWKRAEMIPDPFWRTRASKRSSAVVRGRLGSAAADALGHTRVEWRAAGEVLRAAGREPLPLSDPDVQRHLERVRAGKPLNPLVVAGSTLIDGEHRLSLAYHRNPQTKVPVLDVREKGHDQMAKSKIKKSRQRPRDVDRRQSDGHVSPRDAAGAAARRAGYTGTENLEPAPDNNDELTERAAAIRRANPEMSSYQAMVAATRRDDAVDGLAELAKAERAVPSGEVLTREKVSKATRSHYLDYQARVNPNAAAIYKASRPTWEQSGAPRPVPVAGDDLVAKAQKIAKAEGLSEYEALRQAARVHG